MPLAVDAGHTQQFPCPGWFAPFSQMSKTHKMKTMSKKQLRQIKKRQVNSRTGEIEFVSPWDGGKKK